jgi:hypothetical protein
VHDAILWGTGQSWSQCRLRVSRKCGDCAQQQAGRTNDVSISHRPILRSSSLEFRNCLMPVGAEFDPRPSAKGSYEARLTDRLRSNPAARPELRTGINAQPGCRSLVRDCVILDEGFEYSPCRERITRRCHMAEALRLWRIVNGRVQMGCVHGLNSYSRVPDDDQI